MSHVTVAAVSLACALVLQPGAHAQAADATLPCPFFAPAPDPGQGLDPWGIYPQGRRMPLGFYYPIGDGDMDRLRDGGFTMAAPYYGRDWWVEEIDRAAARGLKAAYEVEIPGIAYASDLTDPLDEDAIRAAVIAQVESILQNPVRDATVASWAVYPDELRSWWTIEMRFLELVANTIRETEQAHGRTPRPVWMYEPNNREVPNLNVTGAHLDLIAKSAYLNYIRVGIPGLQPPAHPSLSRAWIRWSIGHAVEAARTLDRPRTPLAVLDVDFTATNESDQAQIRRATRHDAYLALVTGAKGFLVYGMPYAHGYVFDAYASVATEMTGKLGLGRVLLFGERRDDIGVDVTRGPRTVTVQSIPAGPSVDTEYPAVSFLDVAYGESRYLIAVNSTEESVDVRIVGIPTTPVVVSELFGGEASVVAGGAFRRTLEGLGVGAWRVDPPGGTALCGVLGG